MKTLFACFTLLIVISINTASAQKASSIDHLNHLPKDLKLDTSIIRSYQMTTDYYDFNSKGDFVGKKRLKGTISYGLKGDSAQWKDVYYTESNALEVPFQQGEKQEFMQNFTYQSNEKVITTEFFNDLPGANTLIKNLFWDMLGFDVFAYCCWDSLKLNEEYHAKEISSELTIADIGTFENKDITITWLGITEMNNERCAILKYTAMNNPLKLEMESMSLSGRSHYWGEVYVSLTDKQIEYASLSEDVLTDVKIKGQSNNILGYTVRKINLSRIKW